MKKRIDRLFGRVWHYFDEIAVVGPSREQIAAQLRGADDHSQAAIEQVAEWCDVRQYLTEIGANDLIIFTEKRGIPYEFDAMVRAACELGLSGVEEQLSVVVEHVAHGYEVKPSAEDDALLELSHEALEIVQVFNRDGDFEGLDVMHAAAMAAVGVYFNALLRDIDAARRMSVPLAVASPLHERYLDGGGSARTSSPAEIALDLALPYIDGVPARELLAIRRNEGDSFERFRHALRVAVADAAVAAEADADPSSLAADIVTDVIEPALSDIGNRLSAASRSLERKLTVQIGVAAAATTVGLLAGAPLVLSGGVGAVFAAATATSVPQFFEARREIEVSDMYFLWKVSQRDWTHA